MNEKNLHRFMCTLWYIWKDRYSLIFQNTRPRHQGTIARINHLLQQCSKTLARDLNRNVNSLQVKEWLSPDKDHIKINIDGSYIPNKKKA